MTNFIAKLRGVVESRTRERANSARRAAMRRLSVSAVSNDHKRYAPVVPYPLFILLMALNFFTALPLPANVSVPDGAVDQRGL